jgi:hypothetical protein
MAVYFAGWKEGSFSIVEADDEDEAYELLSSATNGWSFQL